MFQNEKQALDNLDNLFTNPYWAENICEDDDPHTEPVLSLLSNFTRMNYVHAIHKVINRAPKEKQDLINCFLHSRIVHSCIFNHCLPYIAQHFELFPYIKTDKSFIISLFDSLLASEVSFDKINDFCSSFDIQIPKNNHNILNSSIANLTSSEKIHALNSYLNNIGFLFNENDPDIESLTIGERICIKAIESGNINFVKETFPILNRKHYFLFIIACEQKHFKSEPIEKQADLTKWFIEQGYYVNHEKNIILTASRGDVEVCLTLLEHGADLSLMKEHAHPQLLNVLSLYELNHNLKDNLENKGIGSKIKI